VIGFRNKLLGKAHPGIRATVPAARTVLIEYHPGMIERSALIRLLTECAAHDDVEAGPAGPLLELTVQYDGADLDAVAAEAGISREAVIERHSAGQYTVQFCGFSPGFAYLIGLDPVLRLPRLASPRPRVPAGSVAIADEYTGVYPRSSPGGWRLLGRTDAELFDLNRVPPALLTPGTGVRFMPQ